MAGVLRNQLAVVNFELFTYIHDTCMCMCTLHSCMYMHPVCTCHGCTSIYKKVVLVISSTCMSCMRLVLVLVLVLVHVCHDRGYVCTSLDLHI